MGVSISRPPRCERGALPTELIAPEGTHKLAALSAVSHRAVTSTGGIYSVGDARDTHALTVSMRDGSARTRVIEGHERFDDQIDSRVGGAQHLACVAVRFDRDARSDLDDAIRSAWLAGLGELGEHDDAHNRECCDEHHGSPRDASRTQVARERRHRGRRVRASCWRRRRWSPPGCWGTAQRCVVDHPAGRVAEHAIRLVDRRHLGVDTTPIARHRPIGVVFACEAAISVSDLGDVCARCHSEDVVMGRSEHDAPTLRRTQDPTIRIRTQAASVTCQRCRRRPTPTPSIPAGYVRQSIGSCRISGCGSVLSTRRRRR